MTNWAATMTHQNLTRAICALLLFFSTAFAQETNVFPLVSLGDKQNWQAGQDDYRLVVPKNQTKQVRIEVRSPNLNLADPLARGDNNWFLGDEKNDQSAWKSQFVIRTPAQKILLSKSYGADSRNRWERFWNAPLAGGTYPFAVSSTGNGKNAVVVALQHAQLLSSQFSANAFGAIGLERNVAELNVTSQMLGRGLELGNYDADGRELEFYVQLPNGQRRRLISSGSRVWALNEILVTNALLGKWVVRVRVAANLQTSNAFTMRFRQVTRSTTRPFFATLFVSLPTAPPALTTPRLIQGLASNPAVPILPVKPVVVPPIKPVVVPPVKPVVVPPVKPPVTPPVTDPSTSADLELIQSAEPNPVEPNQPFVLTASIRNDGPNNASNTTYRIALPVGLETSSQSSSQGQCQLEQRQVICQLGDLERSASTMVLIALRASNPQNYDLIGSTASATQDPNLSNNTDRLSLAVQRAVLPAQLRLSRSMVRPNPALPGETVVVPMVLENIGEQATDFQLSDDPSALLTANPALQQVGRLLAGERREIEYNATVKAGLPESANLIATASSLETENITAETRFTRVNAGLQLRLASTSVPRPGTSIPIQAMITNPLDRSITVNLDLNAPELNLEQTRQTIVLLARQSQIIEIPARADSSGTFTINANLSLNNVPIAPDASLAIEVRELPSRTRRSQISLQFMLENIPENAEVIIVDRLPDSAALETNSSLLDSQPLANPTEYEDYVFWEVGRIRGRHEIQYTLTHTQALELPENRAGILIRLPAVGNRPAEYRILQGTPQMLIAYQQSLQNDNSATNTAPRLRVGALIVNPVTGTIIRNRKQINVLLDLPLKAEQIRLEVNGIPVPKEQAGSTTYDEGTNRLTIEYVAVELQAGQNKLVLRAFDPETNSNLEDTSLVSVAGDAAGIEIGVVGNLTADPQDRPTLRLEVLDANNLAVGDGVIDWTSDPLPLQPDAAPNIAGYQVQIQAGIALIPLASIGERSVVRAEARLGRLTKKVEFAVISSQRPWVIVGTADISAEITEPFSLSIGIQGFARGNLGNGFLLTLGINFRASLTPLLVSGNLEPVANPFERFPLLGDAALGGQDVNSSDPFYLRLERGSSYVMYGSYQAGFTGRLSAYNSRQQGIQLLWRDPNLSWSAFASYQPKASLNNTTPSQPYGTRGDGTSLYALGNPIQPGSERIRIVIRDQDSLGLIVAQRELVRLIDYSLDPQTGIIFLSKPLTSFDENNNPQFLVVEYAPVLGAAPLEYRFGTQAQLQLGAWQLSGTALSFKPNSNPLLALGLTYTTQTLRLESELAYSSDWALSVLGRYKNGNLEANLDYQALGINYQAPNPSQAASNLRLNVTLSPTETLKIQTSFSTSRAFTSLDNRSQINANATQRLGIFSVWLGLQWQWQTTSSTDNNQGYLISGLNLTLGRLKIGLENRTALTPDTPFQIQASLEYALTDNLRLEIRDTYNFNGDNQGAILLRGNLGSTNISAAYDLPSLSGEAGRARLGIETSLPITSSLTASLGAEFSSQNNTSSLSFSTELRREAEDYNASILAQIAYLPTGIKQVYRFGLIIQPKNSELTFSPSLEMTTGPSGDGFRLSAAGAYRATNLSILTQNQIRIGIYAPNNSEALGEIQSSYSPNQQFTIRGGLGYKYNNDIFTGQINLASRYWLGDNLGIGAQAIWQWQPNIASRLAIGLEATWRISGGLGITGGFNLTGFDSSLGNFSVRPGFYVRLEFLFNEQSFGLR